LIKLYVFSIVIDWYTNK